nr:CASP-like protein PIMP1 [Ipomoea batatas]
MGSPVVSPLVSLVVRVFTIILIVASLIVLATDNITYELGFYGNSYQLKFTDIYAYRYMLSVMVIGLAWILLQSAFTIFHFNSGNPFGGNFILARHRGGGAGFGLTVDAKRALKLDSVQNDFFNKANAAASLLLIAFLLSAISSIFSSYNLPRAVTATPTPATT